MTSLQSPNGNDCGQGVIQDFISDYKEDDDHGYPDNSFEDEEKPDDGLLIETPSGFKIIASEQQMDGRATINVHHTTWQALQELQHITARQAIRGKRALL